MVGGTALLEIGVMFAAIAVAGAVARRLHQSVIPFYILSGMVLSGFVIGAVGLPYLPVSEFIELGAELGIVFLLFFLGLEFSIDRLLERKEDITKVGVLDFAVNFPLGFIIGIAIGWTVLEAFLLAGIVYISSSAVITKSLLDMGWLANPEAEPMLGTLVFEDLVIAVYLAVATALVIGGDSIAESAGAVGIAIGFILVLVLVIYFGTAWFARVLQVDSNEQVILRTIGVTVLIAGAALAVGVSEAVAAFFVGMAFSSTGEIEEIERLLSPVRDVFAAVFFFWIGLVTDPRLFAAVAGLLAIVIVVTGASKLVTGFYSGRIYGLDDTRSVRVGCGMVTRGEFSLIIGAIAAAGTGVVMTEIIPALAVAYVLVMSILGTMLMQHAGLVQHYLVTNRPALPT